LQLTKKSSDKTGSIFSKKNASISSIKNGLKINLSSPASNHKITKSGPNSSAQSPLDIKSNANGI